MAIGTAIKNKILRTLGYDTRTVPEKVLDTIKEKASTGSEWVKERVNPALFPSEEHSLADRVRSANALKLLAAGGIGLGGGYLATHSKESSLNSIVKRAFRDELQKIAKGFTSSVPADTTKPAPQQGFVSRVKEGIRTVYGSSKAQEAQLKQLMPDVKLK